MKVFLRSKSGPIVITGCCATYLIQEEKTPLHHAAEGGHLDTVRMFLKDYHADITVTSTVSEIFFQSSLHHVVICWTLHSSLLTLCCLMHCDCIWSWLCLFFQHNRVPLHYAANSGRVEVVKALVSEFHCPADHRDSVSTGATVYASFANVYHIWRVNKCIRLRQID